MGAIIDKAVNWAVKIAEDDTHGYTQNVNKRWGPDYDCSSLVISAYQQAGVKVKDAGATATSSMYSPFRNCGFQDVTSTINLSSGTGLKRGDVLLTPSTRNKNSNGHTALVVEKDGNVLVHASTSDGHPETGDQTKREVCTRSYYNKPWKYVLRYTQDTSESESYVTNWISREVPNIGNKLAIKSYMGYQSITMTSSMSYKISHAAECITTGGGLRKYRDYYCIAMGSYYGLTGTYVKIQFEDGKIIHCIITDEKKDSETDAKHQYHEKLDGSVLEFVVDARVVTSNALFTKALSADGIDRSAKIVKIWTSDSEPVEESGSAETDEEKKSLDITTSVIKSVSGKNGVVRRNPMDGKTTLGGDFELYIINHEGAVFYPVVQDSVTLDTYRKEAPSTLKFKIQKTESLNFKEGAQVVFKVNGDNTFYGFIFEKSRTKEGEISCIAYDQLRYFKNKDCYVYSDKTAAEFLQMIAEDFNLVLGEIADTKYKIPLRVEDNTTIFDMVQTALDITLMNTGVLYTLYDDFGKLRLAKVTDRIYNFVIDKDTAEDFDYKSTIDGDTCSRVKLYYDNDQTGEREIHIAQDEDKINNWGVLQYCDTLEEGEDGAERIQIYLQHYGRKERRLKVKNAVGNPSIKGGCSIYVDLDLGDIIQRHFMLCESVKHTFEHRVHKMDIELIGGDFTA